MKILKLIVALSSILIANAIYAQDAYVTASSLNTSNTSANGYDFIRVTGTNGEYEASNSNTNQGTISTSTAVTHVTSLAIACSSYKNCSDGDSVTLVIPSGATASVQRQIALTCTSGAAASATIDGSTTYATATTSYNDTVSIGSGTHTLSVYSANSNTIYGPHAVLIVTITYP
jgi:hypothetical protein